jgi:hypothetical protein
MPRFKLGIFSGNGLAELFIDYNFGHFRRLSRSI